MEEHANTEVNDQPTPAPETQAAGPAVSGPPDDWRKLTKAGLVELCAAAGLPATGKRAELVKRLDAHWHGSSTRPVHGKTLCPYCKAPALCNGTRRMSETLLRRSYKCQGKRRHTFTLDEAVAGGR